MAPGAAGQFHWTLPAALYRDPHHYERERQSIFAANWALFTWSARVGKPGDYVAGVLAGYPVFVMRGDDGVLRGFHNVCRHRGATLVAKESGDCGKLLVCPYHSWSYHRDGSLAKASDFGGDVSFDPQLWGLIEIDVAEWRGLVFGRIKRGGEALKTWLGPIDAMAADYPLETQQYFTAKVREVDVDWKAYGENYLECYHCRAMHPSLCAAMDIDRFTIDVHRADRFFHLYAPKRDGGLTRFVHVGGIQVTRQTLSRGTGRREIMQLLHVHLCAVVRWFDQASFANAISDQTRNTLHFRIFLTAIDLGLPFADLVW